MRCTSPTSKELLLGDVGRGGDLAGGAAALEQVVGLRDRLVMASLGLARDAFAA